IGVGRTARDLLFGPLVELDVAAVLLDFGERLVPAVARAESLDLLSRVGRRACPAPHRGVDVVVFYGYGRRGGVGGGGAGLEAGGVVAFAGLVPLLEIGPSLLPAVRGVDRPGRIDGHRVHVAGRVGRAIVPRVADDPHVLIDAVVYDDADLVFAARDA